MKILNYLLIFIFTVFIAVFSADSFAKRKISGYVKLPNGQPAVNFGVIAWDEDGIGGGNHDAMQKTVTNSRGYFTMSYKGKRWDTKVAGSTSFRPDIFVTIHAVQAGVHPVKKSTTKHNWRMSRDLYFGTIHVPAILGTITGSPIPLVVEAYDEDGIFAGKDDYIGKTESLPNGKYMLLYGGKHYDSTPPSPGIVVGQLAQYGTGLPGSSALVNYIFDQGWPGLMHKAWTKWRPDIYLKVKTPPNCGNRLIAKSGVYEQWPHRRNLVKDFPLSSSQISKIKTYCARAQANREQKNKDMRNEIMQRKGSGGSRTGPGGARTYMK